MDYGNFRDYWRTRIRTYLELYYRHIVGRQGPRGHWWLWKPSDYMLGQELRVLLFANNVSHDREGKRAGKTAPAESDAGDVLAVAS